MKVELEYDFKPGDVVWRKNLVTNEAYQVTITRVDVFYFHDEKGESYCVLYHADGEGPMCNLPGSVDANNAFASKEDADACPPYDPAEARL